MKRSLSSLAAVVAFSLALSAAAAPFGSSPSSSPSKSSSSSSSSSSSRSSTPSSAPSKSSTFSSGNVGMQRSQITSSDRAQRAAPPAAPSYTQRYSPPPVAPNYPQRPNTPDNRYGQNYNPPTQSVYSQRYPAPPQYNRSYSPPSNYYRNGYSGSSVALAAVAGAIGGYWIGDVLHSAGNVPFTGYSNGVNFVNGIPQQQAQAYQPQVQQAPVYQQPPPQQQMYEQPVYQAPIPVVQKQDTGHGFFFWLFMILLLGGLAYVVYRFFIRKEAMKNSANPEYFPAPLETDKSQLIRNARAMFLLFQESNKPAGIDYVRNNTTPELFNAIEDAVMASTAVRIVVTSLESEVIDLTNESQYTKIATIKYVGTVVEYDADNVKTENKVNEYWHFTLNNLESNPTWKLAGIEQG